MIQAHPGKAEVGYEIGLNFLSDYDQDEIQAMLGGLPEDESPLVGAMVEPPTYDVKNLPKSKSWMSK